MGMRICFPLYLECALRNGLASLYSFDAEDKSGDIIERTYLEDADRNFWDRMEEFFPSLEEYGSEVGYGW